MKPAIAAIAILVAAGLWTIAIHYGFVPFLESVTGNDIPFWPTLIVTLTIAGWMQVKVETKE